MVPQRLSIWANGITNVTLVSTGWQVFGLNVSLTVELFDSSEATKGAGPGVVFGSHNVQANSLVQI